MSEDDSTDTHHHDHSDHELLSERLPSGRWRVVPESSEVLFRARTLFGIVPVNGEFTEFEGELNVDATGAASGILTVRTASVHSGITRRDAHLRSASILDASGHPTIEFTLESISPSGEDHLDVTGELSIREVVIPLAFTIYAIAHGDHLHIEGRADIDHQAAGLGWANAVTISERARADLALTLVQVPA